MFRFVTNIVSIVVLYVLLAPKNAFIPGLDLASMGMAVKMLGIQFVSVNTLGWYLARKRGWEFKIAFQIVNLTVFISLGYLAYYITVSLIGKEIIVISILSALSLHLLLSASTIYYAPGLVGLSHGQKDDYVLKGKRMFAKLLKFR